jgi:hypothetical protein
VPSAADLPARLDGVLQVIYLVLKEKPKMKYICFGYLDTEKWAKVPPTEQLAMIDRCLAYDETLKKSGHWVTRFPDRL